MDQFSKDLTKGSHEGRRQAQPSELSELGSGQRTRPVTGVIHLERRTAT